MIRVDLPVIVIIVFLLHGVFAGEESIGQAVGEAGRGSVAAAAVGAVGAVKAHARVALLQVGRPAMSSRSFGRRLWRSRFGFGDRGRRWRSGLFLHIGSGNPSLSSVALLCQPPT